MNVSNCVSEFGILLIFILISIYLMRLPDNYYGRLDNILVGVINAIMATQMAASLLIFAKTVILIIKKKRSKITPIITEPENSIKPESLNNKLQ